MLRPVATIAQRSRQGANTGRSQKSPRRLRVAPHERRRDGAVHEQHELHRESVGTFHAELFQEIAEPEAALLLEGECNLIGGVPRLLQLGNRVDERAAEQVQRTAVR